MTFCNSGPQAVGPVALISLLLSDSLGKIVPGAEENSNPNNPANPSAQQAYNKAAIQVRKDTAASWKHPAAFLSLHVLLVCLRRF